MLEQEVIKDELSKRYGGVLFDLAEESKDLKKVLKEAHHLHRYIREEHLAWGQIVSPSTPLHIQRMLIKKLTVFLKLGSLMGRFLMVLCLNRRLSNLTSILEGFFAQAQRSEGILQGVLETPTEVSQKEIDSLQKVLTDHLHKKVLLRQEVKENLLAGVVLRLGSMMVDVSIGTQLTKLRSVMER